MGAVSNVRITTGTGALTQPLPTTVTSTVATAIYQSMPLVAIINDGDGAGIFEGIDNSSNYLFKSLVAGDGIVLTVSNKDITIATNGDTSGGSISGSLAAVAYSGSYGDLLNKPAIPTTLESLTDVVSSITPTSGQVLTYNGTKWAAATPAGSGSATLPAGVTQSFYFDVLFATSNPSGTTNLPAGWSATIDSSNNVIVTTPSELTGKTPFGVSFNFIIFDNTGAVTTQFAPIYPLPASVGVGGYLSYDTTVPNQFTLVNFSATPLGFGSAGSPGALVRVYVSFA